MCWPGVRVAIVGISCWSFMLTGAAARVPRVLHQHVVRVPDNDSLTPAHLAALVERSPTARELIDALERVPDAVLIVRANPVLARQERIYGRGRFWIVGGRLYGLLEYQAETLGSRRALRVLAHELGHALELTSGPWRRDASALRAFVLGREIGEELDDVPGIETEFARVIGRRVGLELRGRVTAGSALTAIARQFAVEMQPPAESPWTVLAENE
jgi:hypothetical protein